MPFKPDSSFKFSAKDPTIFLPKEVFSMPESQKNLIFQFASLARDLYLQKVVSSTISPTGKRIASIQFRRESIAEAVSTLSSTNPEFESVYKIFKSFSSSRVTRTPKPIPSTYLDLIEQEKS